MPDLKRLDEIARQHGYTDYKWFDPRTTVVSHWVRMKCEYGCPSYGKVASCPPNTPSVEGCKAFFSEYAAGLVIHLQKIAPEPEVRRAWSARANLALAKLERDIFLSGYPKAFLLFMDSCPICADCVPRRSECKEPRLSRPSPEGMSVDVYATVRQLGFPIEVRTDPSQQMDRYAFLLVE